MGAHSPGSMKSMVLGPNMCWKINPPPLMDKFRTTLLILGFLSISMFSWAHCTLYMLHFMFSTDSTHLPFCSKLTIHAGISKYLWKYWRLVKTIWTMEPGLSKRYCYEKWWIRFKLSSQRQSFTSKICVIFISPFFLILNALCTMHALINVQVD